jgi:hypothetical protein
MNNNIKADPELQSFAIHVGDFVSRGNSLKDWDDEWFTFDALNIRSFMKSVPLQACIGNHEQNGENFAEFFPYPFVDGHYWSFDYGPAHIVFIDQYYQFTEHSKQLEWLKNDLASTSKKWKFIIFHEPGWSAGGAHKDNINVRTLIQPVAVQYNVTAIFTGHNHYYAHAIVNGIHHITTGGGGAPLYTPENINPELTAIKKAFHYCTVKISDDILEFKAIDINGTVFDTFSKEAAAE